MDVRRRNKEALEFMIERREQKLSETDHRSLVRTVRGLTNFGNEFQNYRSTYLAEVPNSIIIGFCLVLKEIGFNVYLPREADRYNDISTFCIQETWESELKRIFFGSAFICLNKIPIQKKEEANTSIENVYLCALQAAERRYSSSCVSLFLLQHEEIDITHMVLTIIDGLSLLVTFKKRGSAHKVISYIYRKGGVVQFVDKREKITKLNKNKNATIANVPSTSSEPFLDDFTVPTKENSDNIVPLTNEQNQTIFNPTPQNIQVSIPSVLFI